MTDNSDDAVRSPTSVVIVRGAQVLLTRETRGGLLGLPRGRAAKKTRGRDAVAHRATGKQLSSRVREAIARIPVWAECGSGHVGVLRLDVCDPDCAVHECFDRARANDYGPTAGWSWS